MFTAMLIAVAANAASNVYLDTSVSGSVTGEVLKKVLDYVKKIPMKYRIACRDLPKAKQAWEALATELGPKGIFTAKLNKDKTNLYELTNDSTTSIVVNGETWTTSNATVTLADAIQNLCDTYWAFQSLGKFKIDLKYIGGATNSKIMTIFDNLWYAASWLAAANANGELSFADTDFVSALNAAIVKGGVFYEYASTSSGIQACVFTNRQG